MRQYSKLILLSYLILFSLFSTDASARSSKKKQHNGSIYFSWGYNKEWYTKSTINVSQPGQNTNYQFLHVDAHDHPGWDYGIFNKAISIPQYNYRLGYYFNKKQDLGIEINFDHTKYLIADGQYVHMVGIQNGEHVDKPVLFAQSNGFYYFLNNGANFLLFNLVKRHLLYQTKSQNLRLDFLGKVGIGPVIPHVQNSFFWQANQQHFQYGGWNTGVETAIRTSIMRYGYIEFAQKFDYARYSDLTIYEGTVKQNFATYELILSLGFYLPTTKHNPMFTKPDIAPVPVTAPAGN